MLVRLNVIAVALALNRCLSEAVGLGPDAMSLRLVACSALHGCRGSEGSLVWLVQ